MADDDDPAPTDDPREEWYVSIADRVDWLFGGAGRLATPTIHRGAMRSKHFFRTNCQVTAAILRYRITPREPVWKWVEKTPYADLRVRSPWIQVTLVREGTTQVLNEFLVIHDNLYYSDTLTDIAWGVRPADHALLALPKLTGAQVGLLLGTDLGLGPEGVVECLWSIPTPVTQC